MERPGRTKAGIFLGFIITVLVTSLMFLKPSPLETLEAKLLDYRFRIRGVIEPPDDIVIAVIDDKSIERIGRWPWPRDRIVKLVESLANAGSAVIMFDVIFSDPEKNDPELAEAISEAGNVILPITFDFEKETPVRDDEFLISSSFLSIVNQEMFRKYSPISAKGVMLPVASLAEEAMGLGHINIIPDDDGPIRWELMAVEYNGYIYPSIDLQTAAFYMGVPPDRVILKATEGVQLGRKRFIPTDRWGRALIHYYGPVYTFNQISISDILEGKIDPGLIEGKIVLVGITALGLYDLRVSPFSPVSFGVEKHANLIASILDNRFLRAVPFTTNLYLLLISGMLFTFLVSRFKALGASVISGLFIGVLLSAGYLLFVHKGVWVNITYPAMNVLLIFIGVTAYNYAVEERYARKIRSMFSSYVTERVVNELIKNPDMAKLGGEKRVVTVLFSDVMGFTTFSEQNTPEEVVSILNEYLGAMTEIIFEYEGTLDKFVGDEIMAFWGAPMRQENHAELAVMCALRMMERLQELRDKWQSEGKPLLDAGVGLNTGEVVVGNIGAEGKKMDYTIIGDTVNLGARVEALTRKYSTHILITEFTLDRLREKVASGEIRGISFRGLDRVIVKGKERPVGIYEVVQSGADLPSEIMECKDEKVVRFKEK
jgi:adenylate cyclase